MKPYLKAFYNSCRIASLKVRKKCQIRTNGVLLLGYHTRLSIAKGSKILFGRHVISDGRFTAVTGENAVLDIGDGVYFNENVMISCQKKVTVGSGCRFGPGVKIFDNNHLFSRENGVKSELSCGEVSIGKNCWIASNAVILKGAQIGDNCVIGAGCVIKEKIPDGSIVTVRQELKIRQIEDRERT
ncbi:MAG: acyltransferase [Acutalibacteraceae bacterium]